MPTDDILSDQFAQEQVEKQKKNIRDFTALLQKIEELDDKKKSLWIQIFENAITDRQNAYMMFMRMIAICENKSTEHAVHGRTITSYIEKMSRANDQLIKLAELVRRAEEKAEEIDPEELFGKIKK